MTSRKHHVVPQWLLGRFVDPTDGRLWPYDVRRERIEADRPGPAGAGWLLDHNTTTDADGKRSTIVEAWLATEIDNLGAGLLDTVLGQGLQKRAAREEFCHVLHAQTMRTPRGLEQLMRETWPPDDGEPTRDDLRLRLSGIIKIARDDDPWRLARMRWSVLEPPVGRVWVIGDCPVTTRWYDWPAGGGGQWQATLTFPLTPMACLQVEEGIEGWAGQRRATRAEFDEIQRRAVVAADRWVWSSSELALTSLAAEVRRLHLGPAHCEVGKWRVRPDKPADFA